MRVRKNTPRNRSISCTTLTGGTTLFRSFLIFLFLLFVSVNESSSRDITTLDGKTYKWIQIIDSNPTGIQIRSGSGVKLLKFKNLPENIRIEFNYDPQKERRYLEREKKRRIQRRKDAAKKKRQKLKKEKIEAEKRSAALRKKEEESKLKKEKKRLKNHEAKLSQSTLKELKKHSSTGTGFIITNNGYVLTNYHVVGHKKKWIKVVTTQGIFEAELIKEYESIDLALLKIPEIPEKHPALALSSSPSVLLGEAVFTIGYPMWFIQGLSPKVTDGIISGLSRKIKTEKEKRRRRKKKRSQSKYKYGDEDLFYQISVPVQPGNSGGPLLDNFGNVVGVTTWSLVGRRIQNVNYAIKSKYVHIFLKAIPNFPNQLLEEAIDTNLPLTEIIDKVRHSTVFIIVR